MLHNQFSPCSVKSSNDSQSAEPVFRKMNGMAADTEIMVQSERGMKADMKELRDAVAQQSQKVQALNQLLTSNDDDDKKKKKRKGG